MNQPVILDHTQDLSGTEAHRLTKLYPAPEFVKQASQESLNGDPEKLNSHVYADQASRLFPCHTKAATWMSALFFGANRRKIAMDDADRLASRITKSASYFHIQADVEALWQKMADDAVHGYEQLGDDKFALVWEADGDKHRNFPLTNPLEVKHASDWFGQYHREFAFPDKHQIATKILKRASEENVGVSNSELLHRCAGFGFCAAEHAAEAWQKRAALCNRAAPAYAAEAQRLAAVLKAATFEARDQGVRLKMAHLMDQFDQETHLNALYDDGGLARPEEVLFQITEKVASDFLVSHVQTTTGAVYEKMALEKLSIEEVSTWMGEDFAREVTTGGVYLDMQKLADVLPTLPRPDAVMFERMVESLDVPIVGREKAATATGMDDEEREALAATYQPASVLDI